MQDKSLKLTDSFTVVMQGEEKCKLLITGFLLQVYNDFPDLFMTFSRPKNC